MTGMIRHPALAALVVGGGVASADGGLCAEPSGASDRAVWAPAGPTLLPPSHTPSPESTASPSHIHTPGGLRSHAGDRASRRGRLPSRRPAPPGCDGRCSRRRRPAGPAAAPGSPWRGAPAPRCAGPPSTPGSCPWPRRWAGSPACPPAPNRPPRWRPGRSRSRRRSGWSPGAGCSPPSARAATTPGGAGPLDPADEEWLARLAAAFPPPAHALPVEGSRPLRVRSARASLVRELLGRRRRLPWSRSPAARPGRRPPTPSPAGGAGRRRRHARAGSRAADRPLDAKARGPACGLELARRSPSGEFRAAAAAAAAPPTPRWWSTPPTCGTRPAAVLARFGRAAPRPTCSSPCGGAPGPGRR